MDVNLRGSPLLSDDILRGWLKDCYQEAVQSPDPSTQLGAMIVTRHGRSRPMTRLESALPPSNIAHNGPTQAWALLAEDLERPRKYAIFEHAERQVIYDAARLGFATTGCMMIATWAACADCARAIVASGITTLVRHYPPLDEATERWLESVTLGDEILSANGVQVIDVVGDIPGAPPILRAGAVFYPAGETAPTTW